MRALELVVADLTAAVRLHEDALGLAPAKSFAGGAGRCYRLGDFELRLSEALDPVMRIELDSRGPGPFRVQIATRSLAASADWCKRAGVAISAVAGAFDIAPSEALGARLRFIAAPARDELTADG